MKSLYAGLEDVRLMSHLALLTICSAHQLAKSHWTLPESSATKGKVGVHKYIRTAVKIRHKSGDLALGESFRKFVSEIFKDLVSSHVSTFRHVSYKCFKTILLRHQPHLYTKEKNHSKYVINNCIYPSDRRLHIIVLN